jgi:uncharacterized membrane protein
MSEATIVQFLHLLFTVFWIGGMTFMHFVLNPAMKAMEPENAGKLMGVVAKRFTMIAWLSMILLLVTGLLKTPSSYLLDVTTDYGMILLLKHVAFVVMIFGGVLITFVVAPKLRAFAPKPGEAPSLPYLEARRRLGILSGMNMVLGILVIFLISMI